MTILFLLLLSISISDTTLEWFIERFYVLKIIKKLIIKFRNTYIVLNSKFSWQTRQKKIPLFNLKLKQDKKNYIDSYKLIIAIHIFLDLLSTTSPQKEKNKQKTYFHSNFQGWYSLIHPLEK